jgi:hypothetical protein
MLKFIALACAFAFAVSVPVLPWEQQHATLVTMHVFSSSPDPSWSLSPAQVEKLRSSFSTVECSSSLRYPNVGYQGFSINGNRVKGCPKFERALLSSCTVSIKPNVAHYVSSQLDSILAASASTPLSPAAVDSFLLPSPLAPAPQAPALPIRGPDTVPVYDPKSDVQGYFVSHQTENNCYNYANDVATDTFAQPGRGSGQKWSVDTCADINASAIRDGLEWVGTEMPAAPPAVGHHMVSAPAIFACHAACNSLCAYRACGFGPTPTSTGAATTPTSFGRTSPGRRPSRTRTTTGSRSQTRPRWASPRRCAARRASHVCQADVAPWTQFCGYFVTVPSSVNIN